MSYLLLVVKWLSVLGLLAEDPAEDQFAKEVTWGSFDSKPFVLVIADREGADVATKIGTVLHTKFNGLHIEADKHLHSTRADEKVKIIAVAALPDVPGIFKGLFRGGFEDKSTTGVILDWDRTIADACGYRDGTTLLVYKTPQSEILKIREVNTGEEAVAFVSKSYAENN